MHIITVGTATLLCAVRLLAGGALYGSDEEKAISMRAST